MSSSLQDNIQLFAAEKEEADRLAELFSGEITPALTALLNRCAAWDKAKSVLSQQGFEYFALASGVQMPSIYSFVLDTMSDRYRRLTDTLGSLAHPGAVLAMISMFADETFNSAIMSLQARSELDADEFLKEIADAAWAKHKSGMS